MEVGGEGLARRGEWRGVGGAAFREHQNGRSPHPLIRIYPSVTSVSSPVLCSSLPQGHLCPGWARPAPKAMRWVCRCVVPPNEPLSEYGLVTNRHRRYRCAGCIGAPRPGPTRTNDTLCQQCHLVYLNCRDCLLRWSTVHLFRWIGRSTAEHRNTCAACVDAWCRRTSRSASTDSLPIGTVDTDALDASVPRARARPARTIPLSTMPPGLPELPRLLVAVKHGASLLMDWTSLS